jgi:hypothetical protein
LAQVLGGALSSSVGATATALLTSTGSAMTSSVGSNAPTSFPEHSQRKASEISEPTIGGIVAGVLVVIGLLAGVVLFTRRGNKTESQSYEVPHFELVEAPANVPPLQYKAQAYPVEKDARPHVAEFTSNNPMLMAMPGELSAEDVGGKR